MGKYKGERENKKKTGGEGGRTSSTDLHTPLRAELDHRLEEIKLGGLKPGAGGGGPKASCHGQDGGCALGRAALPLAGLTCGLCALGLPSVSAPPAQPLPGPNPIKTKRSEGHLLFCFHRLQASPLASFPQAPLYSLELKAVLFRSGGSFLLF